MYNKFTKLPASKQLCHGCEATFYWGVRSNLSAKNLKNSIVYSISYLTSFSLLAKVSLEGTPLYPTSPSTSKTESFVNNVCNSPSVAASVI